MWLVGPAAARAAEVGDREGAQAAEGRAVQGASHVLRTRSRPNHYERDRRNARALLCPRPDRRVGCGQLGVLIVLNRKTSRFSRSVRRRGPLRQQHFARAKPLTTLPRSARSRVFLSRIGCFLRGPL